VEIKGLLRILNSACLLCTILLLEGSSGAWAGQQNRSREAAYGPQKVARPAGESQVTSYDRPIEDKWAVVIGVSKFKDESIDLKYSAKDAADFANFLVNDGHFAKDHVKVLLNEDATQRNVLDAIGGTWLPQQVKPEDLVVIFASTHGSSKKIDIAKENFLIVYDTDPTKLFATAIRLNDLVPVIKKRTGCDRVVVLLDACHAGAANVRTLELSPQGKNINTDAIAGQGQIVVCSSTADQISWESKRYENSVFTHCLIEALQCDGPRTTLSAAFRHLQQTVGQEVSVDRGDSQTPVLKNWWHGRDPDLLAVPTMIRAAKPNDAPPVVSTESAKDNKIDLKQLSISDLLVKAKAGDQEAQHELGLRYDKGEGLEQSDAEAAKWFLKAADQGNVPSQYNLGVMYQEGQGVSQDPNEAFKWFKKAAEKGYPYAQNSLGHLYESGMGVGQDLKEAFHWYKKAAEQELANAEGNLGYLYCQGKGVDLDFSESFRWFQAAAEAGDPGGERGLGWCYEEGRGVSQSYEDALKWYRKAAEQDDAMACYRLGKAYQNGIGVDAEPAEAVKWYKRAAALGQAEAVVELKKLSVQD